jgi:hypothetical protein
MIPEGRLISAHSDLEMMLADVLQQTGRSIFHHIQHALEPIFTTVIRIGYFTFSVVLTDCAFRFTARAASSRARAIAALEQATRILAVEVARLAHMPTLAISSQTGEDRS